MESNILHAAENTASSLPSPSPNFVTAAYYRHSAGIPLERLGRLIEEALSTVALPYPPLGPATKSKLRFVQLQDDPEEEVDVLVEDQQNLEFPQCYDQLWRVLIAYKSNESAVSGVIAFFVVHPDFKDLVCGGLAFHQSFLAALSLANETKPSSQQTKLHNNFNPIGSLSAMPSSHTSAPKGRTPIKTLTVGAEETALLVIPFRKKTNLTSVIQAALVAALFANLPSEVTTIHAESHISPQELESLGGAMPHTNISGMSGFTHHKTHTRQGLATATVWCEARRVHSAVKAELAWKKSNNNHDCARSRKECSVGDVKDFAEEVEEINVTVFNMGDFRDHKQPISQQQQCWRIGKVVCGTGDTQPGADLSVTLAVGGDGCLTITFAWSGSVVEGAWLDCVIATLRKEIGNLLCSNDTAKATQMSDVLPWGGSMSRLVYLVRDLMLA